MFLKAILLASCMAGIVFAASVADLRLGRNLRHYFRNIDEQYKLMLKNCSDARVHHVILDANSCDSSIYQTMFCQVNKALKHVNKLMCKNVTKILPSEYTFGNDKCSLPTDRILMKDFIPQLKDFVEKLFRKCPLSQNTP